MESANVFRRGAGTRGTVVLTAALVVLSALFAPGASGIPPAPGYGTAVVDGLYEEWEFTDDFFADMYRAGDPGKPLESKLYLRYDCEGQVMFVLVLTEQDVIGFHSSGSTDPTSWVAVDHHNQKVVNEDAGNDGFPPDFSWVGQGYDGNPEHMLGFEASFPMTPGTYHLFVHTLVWDDLEEQTSATIGHPRSGPLLVIDCPPVYGACCFPDAPCRLETADACADAVGTWQGAGTACEPDPCPHPEGACCAPNGDCRITTQVLCVPPDSWQGSPCDPNPCVPSPTERLSWGRVKDRFR